MLVIPIAQLVPATRNLSGAAIGEAHAAQLRETVRNAGLAGLVVLDFEGIENASASYLKRVIAPFFTAAGSAEGFAFEVYPVLVNARHPDLAEELSDYLAGKKQVLVQAKTAGDSIRFDGLIGELDGAAHETFQELRTLREATAAQLYDRHPRRTANQTAWNNRLAQLVDLRLARRRREGRFWIYQSTVNN